MRKKGGRKKKKKIIIEKIISIEIELKIQFLMVYKQFHTDTNIKSALFTFLKAWCGYIVTSPVLGYFPGF